jgi:hypothetical protein
MSALTDYPGRLVVVCPQFSGLHRSTPHRWRDWFPTVCILGYECRPRTHGFSKTLSGYDVNFGHPDGYRMIERVYDIGTKHPIMVRFKLGYSPDLVVLKAQAYWYKPDAGTPDFPCPLTLIIVGQDGPESGQTWADWKENCPYKVWNSTWNGIHVEGHAFEEKKGYPLPVEEY